MDKNIFGNLNDWGIVLDTLNNLSENRNLDQHQDELIRLLRFDRNWRLREAAIESLSSVENPTTALVKEVLSLINRKDLYYDVRILASDGLEKLTATIVKSKILDKDSIQNLCQEIITNIDSLLSSIEPPKFHDALPGLVDNIKNIKASV